MVGTFYRAPTPLPATENDLEGLKYQFDKPVCLSRMDAAMLDVVGGDGASDDVAAATPELLQRGEQDEEGSLRRFLQTPTFTHIYNLQSLLVLFISVLLFYPFQR